MKDLISCLSSTIIYYSSYCMMWNEELAEIPISNLLDTNGLVVVWCTNAESHISSLKNKIFPRWGVQFIAEWFWLKVGNFHCRTVEVFLKLDNYNWIVLYRGSGNVSL